MGRDPGRGLEYEPSEAGRDAVASLAEHVGVPTEGGALCTPPVVAVPSRVVEDPAGTVGIGDAVSAARFALEVAVSKSATKPRASERRTS